MLQQRRMLQIFMPAVLLADIDPLVFSRISLEL